MTWWWCDVCEQELLAEVPGAGHTKLWSLLSTLKRICCATAYLHAFSQEVLWLLEARLLQVSYTHTRLGLLKQLGLNTSGSSRFEAGVVPRARLHPV